MYTYIIIDDERLTRLGTIKKLTDLDCIISCIGEADNGKEGISLIEKLHPDIVILDMQMPVMNGTELLPYLSCHYPDLPLVVISGYKDFNYIKHAMAANAIDYILKPFNKSAIQNAMTNAIKKLEEKTNLETMLQQNESEKESACYEYDIQLIKNLILGYHVSSRQLTSHRLEYINNTHQLYLMTLIMKELSSDISIQRFFEENGFGDFALCLPYDTSEQLHFVILFQPLHPIHPAEKAIRQITDACTTWLEQQGISSMAGISSGYNSINDLNSAFHECSAALDHQYINGYGNRFQFFDPDIKLRSLYWNKEHEFLFRIEAGMETEVCTLVNELFQYFKSISNCTLRDVKHYCFLLSNLCRNIISYYFSQTIDSDFSSMQNNVITLFSLSEIKEYYQTFFLNITRLLSDKSIYATDDVVAKVKYYVQRNYDQDLNMEFISSLFYMNRSYLSHLFKQKTGINFVDYVNQIRIEKAKDLLIHSDRKMYQIAKTTGYDNIKYFFRIFKKYEHITPEQYRSNYRNIY